MDKIKEQSTTLDLKVFQGLATEVVGKTKAYSAYRKITNRDQSDADMVSFVNKIEDCFERDCHYRNDKYIVTGEITKRKRNPRFLHHCNLIKLSFQPFNIILNETLNRLAAYRQ